MKFPNEHLRFINYNHLFRMYAYTYGTVEVLVQHVLADEEGAADGAARGGTCNGAPCETETRHRVRARRQPR